MQVKKILFTGRVRACSFLSFALDSFVRIVVKRALILPVYKNPDRPFGKMVAVPFAG